MKKLAKYLKPYWKAALLAPLMMMLEVAMELIQPKLMADIVDYGVVTGDINFIIKTGLIMVGAALLGIIGGVGCIIFSSIASQNFGTDLRTDAFKKIQSFSFSSLDEFKTASLITRLTNDVVQVQNIVQMMMRMMVRAPFLCIGGLVMALSINPRLALILLATIPVLVIALLYVIKRGIPFFKVAQKKLDAVNTVMRENLSGVRVVKAFVRSDYEKKRFATVNDEQMEVMIKASRVVVVIIPIMMLIMNLSIVAVIWFGGLQVNIGNMMVGQVMAFINYMTQILFALMMVGMIFMMLSRSKASTDRILEVLETETEIKNKENPITKEIRQGAVDFKNVSFQYRGAGGPPILRNINFSVKPGETVAILGATGAGKSTLVHLIPRFYDVTEGEVLVDGVNVKEMDIDTLRQEIGMVLQESILFSGTIAENIRWGKEGATDEEVIQAAKAAQAHDFIISLPEGYNTILGQRGVNLSGGQKQRLSIARALLKKPAILIMDDSTSAVDMKTEGRIQQALKEMMQNTTSFIIAQRISSVLEADKILVLEDGEIVDIGTHSELIKRCTAYQDIYHSQLGEEAV